MAGREVYEFGEFTLDVSERRLSKGGEPVPLEPKAHEVLLALVRNAGRLLTKRELLELVWPESFVEEGILAVHVSGLRKALGQGGRRCIETVSGAGYRFIVRVSRNAVQMAGGHGFGPSVCRPRRRPRVPKYTS